MEQDRLAAGNEPEVRLLALCAGDPEAARTFSGSARSLFRAMERRGMLHGAPANVSGVSNIFSKGNAAIRLSRRLDRFGLWMRYRWSDMSFARNTRRAHAVAAGRPGFNACFLYGTTYNPQVNAPKYCYFDATVAQVAAAREWDFGLLPERVIARVRAYQRRVFDECACVFPRTQWAAQSCYEDYGLPPEKVCVAGAGSNHEARPLPHGPYDRQTILFIGTEFARKGGPLIVEAFRRVRQVLPQARLVIIGCRPPIDEPGVEAVGRIGKDEPGGIDRLLHYYSQASVFCIMSHFEPFGVVVVEAQNSYVPCVAPARFAFRETIVDGETGCLVPEYDAAALAQTLTGLLRDPARLEAMGRAAHDHARRNYTWDEAARRIGNRIREDLVRNEAETIRRPTSR